MDTPESESFLSIMGGNLPNVWGKKKHTALKEVDNYKENSLIRL